MSLSLSTCSTWVHLNIVKIIVTATVSDTSSSSEGTTTRKDCYTDSICMFLIYVCHHILCNLKQDSYLFATLLTSLCSSFRTCHLDRLHQDRPLKQTVLRAWPNRQCSTDESPLVFDSPTRCTEVVLLTGTLSPFLTLLQSSTSTAFTSAASIDIASSYALSDVTVSYSMNSFCRIKAFTMWHELVSQILRQFFRRKTTIFA